MRTNIQYREQNNKVKYLKILFFIGAFVTILSSFLLVWDLVTDVGGSEVNAIDDLTAGTSVICEQVGSENISIDLEGNKKWLLLGPEFEKEDNTLYLDLTISKGSDSALFEEKDISVSYIVDGGDLEGNFNSAFGNKYEAELPVDKLEPGIYKVYAIIETECVQIESNKYEFNVSYPLYVTWTQDWEGTEIKDQYLNDMEKISTDHGVPMTHFFNPRIYVTNAVSPQRAQYFTDWVLRRERENGDDIGLHLHMFPDMLQAAGVEPRTEAVNWGQNRNDGYDVLTSEYSEQDMIKVMTWSKQIFIEKGLGDPLMYRAGGWFADEETLSAAQATGFVLDSSGRTAYQLGNNEINGHWNLSSNTQPYIMNSLDQNVTNNPDMDLWQFPNNGGDSWAFSAEEMISRFNDNYSGEPLETKKVVTYLSHPHWFYEDKPKLEVLFTEIDKNLYDSDNGPVIYTTLSDSYTIWSLSDGNN